MKRKRDFPDISLKTLLLWVARETNQATSDRVQYEIEQRQKELQQ